ncbi:phage protease [Psychromonas sp. MME2]|uniref:phage protease n=1 Tax=unclassified Psychromonas TaxID=2614957 RepID=UPI00339C8F17
MKKLNSTNIAALVAEILDVNDGWHQLLPAGFFKAVDGRPHDVATGQWYLDAQVFEQMKARTPHQASDLVIDYEHQTLNAKSNGNPAPASGYFNLTELEFREGEGLFVKPRFTDKALAFIKNKEYRYLSCVFAYDTETGKPTYLHSAALTNRPGVDGMAPLAELSAQLLINSPQHKEATMNKLLIDMLAKLGIDLPDANNVTPEQATAALSALDNLQTDAAKVEGLKTQLVALTAESTGVDLTKFVPVETYNALNTEFAALSANSGKAQVEGLVKQAFDEGKIRKSEMGYLTDLGNQHGIAALTASLDVRVPIAALNATQTDGKAPTDKVAGLAQLSAEDVIAADLLGISHADFAQSKGEK